MHQELRLSGHANADTPSAELVKWRREEQQPLPPCPTAQQNTCFFLQSMFLLISWPDPIQTGIDSFLPRTPSWNIGWTHWHLAAPFATGFWFHVAYFTCMASSTWFWKSTEQEPSLDGIEGEAAALIFFQQKCVPCDFSPVPRSLLGTRAICTCGSMTFSAPRPKRYQGRTISSCALWLQQHRHTSPCSIVDGCLGRASHVLESKLGSNPQKQFCYSVMVWRLYCSSRIMVTWGDATGKS